MSRLVKLERPLLCYVSDRHTVPASEQDARGALLDRIAAAAEAGVDWIQIREKDLSGKECATIARQAVQLAASSEATARARVLVNDRLDVALATQAGGVHLGDKSIPPQEARRLVNLLDSEKDFLIGVSCHSLEAGKAAEHGGADYLFFGPVFATPSKAVYGAPQGLERLTEVCRAVAIPVLAIGGITLENSAACLSAGASGIAAIRLFQDAADMAAVVRVLRSVAV